MRAHRPEDAHTMGQGARRRFCQQNRKTVGKSQAQQTCILRFESHSSCMSALPDYWVPLELGNLMFAILKLVRI